MKWYERLKKEELKRDRPVIAQLDGMNFLLLPQKERGSYKIIGYDWFNLQTGNYNSVMLFSFEEAILTYRKMGYVIFNATVYFNEVF